MKEFRKIYVMAFVGYWASYSGLIILVRNLRGKDLQSTETLIIGFILATMYVGVAIARYSKSIKPKIKYLESDDPYEPKFGDHKEIKIENDEISFDQLKNRIADQWIITHVDFQKRIIKFRTKFGFFNWGAGGYLDFKPEQGIVHFVSIPIGRNSKRVRRLTEDVQTEVERLVNINPG